MIKSNRGQLSIFMGICLIIVMGMLAFIINVGLFVKAKINLQNATDAAAFSGAAVQARQLTNIAYVNWEMRNTFKEWMFKYYILGQLGLVKGNNNLSDGVLNSNARASYLLRTPTVGGNNLGFDKYNVPTICVHNNSSTDICPIYALPGIPRFPAIGVAGISEIHEAFVDKLVSEKGANCTARTQINFLAALSWAYSSGIKETAGAPLIATNRAGAWPEAVELAMRMRNLEMIMNRPPVESVDINSIKELTSFGSDIGFNERPVKAYMSAFRNLGGGKYKNQTSDEGPGEELSGTFKLTELAPQSFHAEPTSVSGFLIPNTFSYPGGLTALDKHYVDLQTMPVNYATMFTTFVTGTNNFEAGVETDANCRVSKSAIPIPGYLLGFVKNPQVVTYYAVKGEAEFTGLFFPRNGSSASRFKLTAYAAAKPFGGRIGPKLFGFDNGGQSVTARVDENSRSMNYMSGVDVEVSTGFKPGMPIPSSQAFWVNNLTSIVGGVPGTNSQISFGIPNMIYDFRNDSDLAAVNGGGGAMKVQTVKALPYMGSSTPEFAGLYNSYQVKTLKQALGGDFTGQTMRSEDLMKALVTARQVTRYDAVNYLIPDFPRSGGDGKMPNASPQIPQLNPLTESGGVGFSYKLFAPLVGPGLLYTNNNQVGNIVMDYMKANDKAIDVYLQSLLEVANSIADLKDSSGNTTTINLQAARSIHANAGTPNAIPPFLTSPDPNSDVGCNKTDMASKFNHFFRGKQTQCGIVPMETLMIDYIDKKNQGVGSRYYVSTYLNKLPQKAIMTAYYPGGRQGVDEDSDATAKNPIGVPTTDSAYSTRRNYYSTKFIPLSKLFASRASYKEDVYLESDTTAPIDSTNLIQQNPLKDDGSTGLNNKFFSDF